MNFFVRKEKRAADCGQHRQEIERQVLEDLLRFTADLALPVPSKRPVVQLAKRTAGQEGTPDYLLIRSEEAALFNAGYLAGQAASFLRFRGIEASLVREVPWQLLPQAELRIHSAAAGGTAPGGRRFAAAIAFGGTAQRRSRRRGGSAAEYHCICRDSGMDWCRELLYAVKGQMPSAGAYVCAGRDGDCLHIRSRQRGRSQQGVFEAGLALATVMSAAERLWIDLEFIDLSSSAVAQTEHRIGLLPGRGAAGRRSHVRGKAYDRGYCVSVCRRADYDRLLAAEQEVRAGAGERADELESFRYSTLAYRI